MKNIFAALAVLIVMAGCSAPETARRVLSQNGYTNIQIQGWAPMGCSQDDTFSTRFTATSPSGARVSGVVCSGMFMRGSVIRLW